MACFQVKLPPKKPSPAREVQKITTKGKTLIISTADTSSSDEDENTGSTYSGSSNRQVQVNDTNSKVYNT